MNRKSRRTQAALLRRAADTLVIQVDQSVSEEEFTAVKAHMAKQGMAVERKPISDSEAPKEA